MLIPSTDLLRKFHGAKVGLWPELLDDDSVALAAKVPLFAVKALYRGARCSLNLSVIKIEEFRIFYLGFCIYDDSLNPLTITQPVTTQDEQIHFKNVFRSSPVSIHFFDELYNPGLEAKCAFDSAMATTAIETVLATSPHKMDVSHPDIERCIDFESAVNKGFNILQRDLPSIQKGISSVAIINHIIPLSLTIEKLTIGYAVNTQGNSVEFTIDQKDEGGAMEESLYLVLDDLYNGWAFLRPTVQVSGKVRELTDLLCFDYETNTICLVQAKTIAGMKVRIDQPTKRRSASIQKDFKQAQKQLTGAIGKIRSGNSILDDKGSVIKIPHRDIAPIHAIALISDLHPSVDWRKIGKYLTEISESKKYRALFQVLDLQELQHMVANSTSAKDFHNFLLQRWAMMKLHGTAYLRGLSRGFPGLQNSV